MILGFGAVVYIGHWALVALVFALQVFGFRELAHIRDTIFFDAKKKNPPPYTSGFFDVYEIFISFFPFLNFEKN